MARMIFVNLPVTDLAKSKAFYEGVGAVNEPKFTNDLAAAMVFSESIFVMLLTHAHWKTFTSKPIVDAHANAQVMLCLSAESREAVDAQIEAAVKAGGKGDPNPTQDYGVMYGRSIADPDGHIWEIMWMDAAAAERGAEAVSEAIATAV